MSTQIHVTKGMYEGYDVLEARLEEGWKKFFFEGGIDVCDRFLSRTNQRKVGWSDLKFMNLFSAVGCRYLAKWKKIHERADMRQLSHFRLNRDVCRPALIFFQAIFPIERERRRMNPCVVSTSHAGGNYWIRYVLFTICRRNHGFRSCTNE